MKLARTPPGSADPLDTQSNLVFTNLDGSYDSLDDIARALDIRSKLKELEEHYLQSIRGTRRRIFHWESEAVIILNAPFLQAVPILCHLVE